MRVDAMLPVIILAGGASTRFSPFQRYGKSLVRMMGKTILGHTLERLTAVQSPSLTVVYPPIDEWRARLEEDHLELTGIHFVEQKEPKGQADAILTAWKAMRRSSVVVVMNAQHVTAATILPKLLSSFARQKRSIVLVQQTDNPWKYGVVETKGDSVVRVVEKPATGTEPSRLRIVGVYGLTAEAIDTIASLPSSQYQLEDGLNRLAQERKLGFVEVKDVMPSLKYPWDLFGIKDLLLKNDQYIDKSAFVHKTAVIEGPCWIGQNAVVGAFCLLRKGVILEEGAQAERYLEVKNSIIGKDSHIHSGFVGDSVIGEHCRIGAGFITANRRFDRKNIRVSVKDELVDSGTSSLGAMIGDDVSIGIHCGTMPGTIVAPQVTVWPGTIVRGTIEQVESIVKHRRGPHVI